MTVLYVSDSTTVSGAEMVLLGYLEGLNARGYRAYGYINRRNPRLIEAFRERGVPCTATDAYTDRIIRTTVNPAALAGFGRAFYAVAGEMASVIREADVDVIHSISYPASLYAAFAAARLGTPQIWHEHNIKRLHRVNRVIYRKVAETCRWIIGPSDAVTGNLAKAGIDPAKLRTVYNGIDLRRFQAPQPDRVPIIRKELGLGDTEKAVGLFGQMLPHKGHRTLIEAAPHIRQRHPHTRFYFVGALENPPYERELQALIADRALGERFAFTGWRRDVQDVIRAMDVIVIATTTPEPAALMLMEAMAMERPVVATCTGGTPEIVEDGRTGLLFRPGDANDLAKSVCRLLADPQLARSMGASGRRRVQHAFALERHLETISELYQAAVPRGHTTSREAGLSARAATP
jgi:glycosyltransferase involved in cell wall biosynthesis